MFLSKTKIHVQESLKPNVMSWSATETSRKNKEAGP